MKFKKAIIFLLCAIMSLSMFACGTIDSPPDHGNGGGKTYTVTFDIGAEAQDAGVTVSLTTKSVEAGLSLGSLPTVSGEYEGYRFGGWYYGDTQYTDSSAINSDITLTAKWNPAKKHTVTFALPADAVAAGVKVSPTSKEVEEFKSIGGMPSPTPRKYNGLAFAGWFDSSDEMWSTDNTVTGPVTLTAKFIDNSAQEAYEENIASWAKSGHLYIHYKRYNHIAAEETTPPAQGVSAGNPNYNTAINSKEYGDWGLWAWPKKNQNGRLFNAAWIDVSGAVYDIDLSAMFDDCGWDGKKFVSQNIVNTFRGAEEIGLQIHQISTRTSGQGFWANDGGDNYLEIAKFRRETGDYHWFVSEGRVSNKVGYGSASFADVGDYDNPYADDIDHTLNGTRTSGDDIINSVLDNSATYPLKKLDNFDASNGYQIFIASFCDSDGDGMGDIPGIISKLDYLKSLSIDMLWLTPFQTSTNYHGYDINDYYTVDSRWGTEADYRALVEGAHNRGMKIVMDFVLNHTSLSNEWYIKSQNLVKEQNVTLAGKEYAEVDYRQFYNWITEKQYNALTKNEKTHWYKDNYDYYYYSSFSSSQPELNYDYQPVRDAILDVCYHWMEYGLDGFRLDAVKHIYMCNEVKGKLGKANVTYKKEFKAATNSGNGNLKAEYEYVSDDDARFNYDVKRNLNFYREFNARLKAKYPTAFVVGENLDGWDQRTATFYQGIDSQFDFALYYNIPRGILHAAGVGGSFGDGLGAIYNRYNRGRTAYNTFNDGYIGGQFTSNHDLPRARDRVNVTNVDENGDNFGSFYTNNSIDGQTHIYDAEDTIHKSVQNTGTIIDSKVTTSTEMLKVYYAALMTLPGVTWLYYGDELGMSGLMQHTLSCTKPNLRTSSTASDPHEDIIYRQPMKWNKATAAIYNENTNTSHGNAAFKIGYGDKLCELVGINATNSVPSVGESTDKIENGIYTFKNGTLVDWVAKLNKMRKDKGITGSAKVTLVNQSNDYCEYRVEGTNGTITAKFSTGAISGSAYGGLKFDGSKIHVLITA
ncbi:MAG: hypothetical protein K2O04_03675 [Clostridiales bacterium]|nr:hypothetical protein [Clostridiales bacterium]